MKSESVIKKIKKIESILTRMENGLYPGASIEWVVDQVAWLWKFRYITYDQMADLTTRVCDVISLVNPN